MSEIEILRRRISMLEGELEAEENRLEIVLQSIVDGVYTTDNQRKITFWNRGAERITGYMAEEVIGKPCSDILRHVDEKGASLCANACPISESMAVREAIYGKSVYSGTASGKPIPVSVSCAPIIDSKGDVAGAIEVFRDISEQKKLEKQKADFYSMITHDLKSPLTVILGYAELMAEADDIKEDYRRNLNMILENGNRMDSMIKDYLAISNIESRHIPLVKRRQPLCSMIEMLAEGFKSTAIKKDIIFKSYCPSLPDVEYDEKLIERAISNLISNAIKFTPPGGAVTVSAKPSGNDVIITVADTGPGIPDDEKEKVFDMYFRSRASSGVEGTGLGLAIAKSLIEEHGGNIDVQDSETSGSVFKVTLPVNSPLQQSN